jgi:hypothetical protein
MNFNQQQYKLIFNAVRRYQIEKCILDSKEYQECSDILNQLFAEVYTQQQEQTT